MQGRSEGAVEYGYQHELAVRVGFPPPPTTSGTSCLSGRNTLGVSVAGSVGLPARGLNENGRGQPGRPIVIRRRSLLGESQFVVDTANTRSEADHVRQPRASSMSLTVPVSVTMPLLTVAATPAGWLWCWFGQSCPRCRPGVSRWRRAAWGTGRWPRAGFEWAAEPDNRPDRRSPPRLGHPVLPLRQGPPDRPRPGRSGPQRRPTPNRPGPHTLQKRCRRSENQNRPEELPCRSSIGHLRANPGSTDYRSRS